MKETVSKINSEKNSRWFKE